MRSLFLFTLLTAVSSTNIPSSVLDLNERFLEVKDQGLWFVKLYAPWCAHCKRLAPIWEHVGHAINDKGVPVRMAKMDCTRFPAVCSTLGVNAYPTLLFFRHGKQLSYEGERKKENLIEFATKASAALVGDVKNMVELNEIREKSREDPSFFYIGDETSDLRTEFDRAAEVLFSKTRFFKVRPEIVPSQIREAHPDAKVFTLKDEGPMVYDGDSEGLHSWILGERWITVPQAVPSNIADLSSTGKKIVLLIITQLERKNMTSPVGVFYDNAEQAAKTIAGDTVLHKAYQFAWMDGNDVANSIILGTMPVPGLLVFNYTSYEYYLGADDATKMTKQSIVDWLRDLHTNGGVPQGGRGMVQRLNRIVYEVYTNVHQMFATQPLLSTCLFGVPIAFLSIITYSICSADFSVDRDEIYNDSDLDDEEDLLDGGEMAEGSLTNSNLDPDHQKAE